MSNIISKILSIGKPTLKRAENPVRVKTNRKWNPIALYFKKENMSVFCWLTMEKKIKKI